MSTPAREQEVTGMASPQVENGFTRTANELEEQFYRREFTARQHAVIGWVKRHTYGWDRKLAPFTRAAIARDTRLDERHVRRTIGELEAAGVLLVEAGGVGIQKDYERWLVPERGANPARAKSAPPGQVSPGQVGPGEGGQVGPDQGGPSRPGSTPPKPSDDADSQAPKTSIKTSTKTTTPLPPKGDDAAGGFSEEDVAVLNEALGGLAFDPKALPGRLCGELYKKASKLQAADEVITAWNAMPNALKALWARAAMAIARAEAKDRTGWISYAAGVIAKRLEAGTDLLAEQGAKPAPSNILMHPAAQGAQPEPWEAMFRHQGSSSDETMCSHVAAMLRDKHGLAIDTGEAFTRCLSEGKAATGRWLYGMLQEHRKKREVANG
jgi:phage replication O-like protein O